MQARIDLAKCDGGGLACCGRCTRNLAPSAPGQNWTVPVYRKDGSCSLFADVAKYGQLYGMTKKEIEKHAAVGEKV